MATRKSNIEVVLEVDTREQSLDFLKKIRYDKVFKSDKIKIVGHEIVAVKPLGCKKSTGDISFKYRLEKGDKWFKSNLAIELKKKGDLYSTIMPKAGEERFYREIQRAEDAGLDFYIITDISLKDIENNIKKLKAMNRISKRIDHLTIFIEKYIKLCERVPVLMLDEEYMPKVIRRLVKINISKHKLQYKESE